MNADQAWDEFQDQINGVNKSDATVSSKLDVLANLLADVGNDTSRTAETVIPQLAGDQGAIDAANDQAAALGGAPPMGAPGEMPPADPGMGEPPMDAGAPDMGAPAPDMGGMPPAGPDMGAEPPMDMPPAPDMGAGVPPAPDMAPPIGGDMGGAPPMDMGAPDMAPPMGGDTGGMPPMGGDMGGMPDYSQFAYTKDDIFSDMLAGMTSEAHNALDQGNMEEVAKITQFIEGVQALWTQTFGAAPLPADPDPAQISAMPAEAMGAPDMAPPMGGDMGGMPPMEAPAPEMPPAEGGASDMPGDMPPETGGEPAGDEPADDGPEEGPTEDEAEKEKASEEDKDDDDKVKKSEGCDKSEEEEDVEKADDAGADTPAEEASDAVTDDAVDKATGVTDIKPGSTGVKKSFFGDRMNIMEAVMNEKQVPQDAFMPLRKSEMPEYQRTSNLDVRQVFADGGCIKSSSRPSAASAMGDYRSRGDEAMQDKGLSDSLNNLRKSFAPQEDDGEADEMTKQMNRLTTGLRIRRAA